MKAIPLRLFVIPMLKIFSTSMKVTIKSVETNHQKRGRKGLLHSIIQSLGWKMSGNADGNKYFATHMTRSMS